MCPLLCLLHFQSFLFMALIIYLGEYVLFLLGLSVLFCLLKFNYKTCSHTPSLGKFLPSSLLLTLQWNSSLSFVIKLITTHMGESGCLRVKLIWALTRSGALLARWGQEGWSDLLGSWGWEFPLPFTYSSYLICAGCRCHSQVYCHLLFHCWAVSPKITGHTQKLSFSLSLPCKFFYHWSVETCPESQPLPGEMGVAGGDWKCMDYSLK